MRNDARLACFLLVCLSCGAGTSAQQNLPDPSGQRTIHLDVVVSSKSGPPVTGLQQQDFTLLDNKVPQTITSFKAFGGRDAPIDVILVVDSVNTSYQNVAYERNEIDKFLRADAGSLAHPTGLAVLADKGMQIQAGFSTDGNALSTSLDQFVVGLREINRSAGFWGDSERFQISTDGLRELAARESSLLGRKIIVWVSPGWPLLSGPRIQLDPTEQKQIFAEIVSLSTALLQARITLCSIDPLGNADTGFNTFYWKEFVKGVSKTSQVQVGDLALPVLAVQSGGVALNSNNDTTGLLRECVAEMAPYYEISFTPAPAKKRDEYHALEIQLANHGLTARTRQGYYAEP